MPRPLVFTALATFGIVLSVASAARASDEFPWVITDYLGLDYLPECGLCHDKGNIGSGTAITPFALNMKQRGLGQGEDLVGLQKALERMANDGVDSDGDGVTDIEELSAGTNPNSPARGASIRDPRYGCSLAGGSLGTASICLFALAIALAFARRRTRPCRAG